MRFVELPGLAPLGKIGLGTWQFGAPEWGYGHAYARGEAAAIVRRALDLGVTLIDSAEIYGFGRSERIVGEAIADRREQVFLATKLLPVLPLAAVVRRRAHASARRLGTRIDLYQLHWPNPFVPLRSTARGLRALQDEGLIAEIGVSNYSLARWQRLEAALGRRVLSNEVEYSLAQPAAERDLIPYAAAHERLVIAYSPLGRGLLGGRYSSQRRPRNLARRGYRLFRKPVLERAKPLLGLLREVAEAHDATLAQVALAWTIRHPCVVAIPGASSVAQVEENTAAADLELGPDEIEALANAGALLAR
jgi:aryl-alcohol dehydrogenase-like predicted oxidoreductase